MGSEVKHLMQWIQAALHRYNSSESRSKVLHMNFRFFLVSHLSRKGTCQKSALVSRPIVTHDSMKDANMSGALQDMEGQAK